LQTPKLLKFIYLKLYLDCKDECLDKIYSDSEFVSMTALKKITCSEKDSFSLYEYFVDFNGWIDGDEGLGIIKWINSSSPIIERKEKPCFHYVS
jgi:hypothetical protein